MLPLLLISCLGQANLQIPGNTAYLSPNPEAFQIDERSGVRGWNDPKTRVVWYGKLLSTGKISVSVKLDPTKPMANSYRLKLNGATHSGESDKVGMFNFGEFNIREPGYQSFELEAIGKKGDLLGVPQMLILSGPAIEGAQFNLKPRRNAASVHLGYPTSADAKITAFYCEVDPKTDPTHTFYMACGFRRGYFGMQVNSPTERRVIFSIWDSGNEAIDRNKVKEEDRVKLLAKGDAVYASDFGNEGTGGHSHLKSNWKMGKTFKFLVTAKPEGTTTTYTSYFWFPDRNAWGMIASFRAPKDGGYLKGLHSFNENFWGTNGNLKRRAEYKNQWIQTEGGKWTELTKARFTCDPTGRADRFDYTAAPVRQGFFLQNGGFEDNGIKFGDEIDRPPTNRKPSNLPAGL